MRATKAYIASLGTTGLLLAFSASLLVVVGTLFAFNAWPGAEIRDAVVGLAVDDDEDQAFRVSGPAQVALDAAPAAIAVASAPPPGTANPGGGTLPGGTTGGGGTTLGGQNGGNFEGTGGTGGGSTPGVDGGPIGGGDPAPSIDTGGPTNDLADATEQATNNLGQTVGNVNPELGNQVSDTGQALSDIVRDLPDVNTGGGGVQVGNLKVGGN